MEAHSERTNSWSPFPLLSMVRTCVRSVFRERTASTEPPSNDPPRHRAPSSPPHAWLWWLESRTLWGRKSPASWSPSGRMAPAGSKPHAPATEPSHRKSGRHGPAGHQPGCPCTCLRNGPRRLRPCAPTRHSRVWNRTSSPTKRGSWDVQTRPETASRSQQSRSEAHSRRAIEADAWSGEARVQNVMIPMQCRA